jgi:hypothetical protein
MIQLQLPIGRKWNKTVNKYSESQQIDVTPGCFAYMFTNLGDVIARLDDIVIFPSSTPGTALGDSRTLGAHVVDYYAGNMTLVFEAPTAGVNPLVEVIQLFYVPQ